MSKIRSEGGLSEQGSREGWGRESLGEHSSGGAGVREGLVVQGSCGEERP